MKYPFAQGWLDSLCSVYGIVNAYRILYNATESESQELFNSIITYLSKKRMLRDTIINGTPYKRMVKIMNDVIGETIPIKESNKKNITTVNDWWNISTDFMNSGEKRVIILSVNGKQDHDTVVKTITDKAMLLFDSGGMKTIRKSQCKIKGYLKEDKYIIWPSQCWFLGL